MKNVRATILNKINNDSGLYADKNTIIITTNLLSDSVKYNFINIDGLIAMTTGYLKDSKFWN